MIHLLWLINPKQELNNTNKDKSQKYNNKSYSLAASNSRGSHPKQRNFSDSNLAILVITNSLNKMERQEHQEA